MINLLPTEIKDSYRHARANVHLLRWLCAFVIALVGLGLIGTAGVVYLRHATGDYQQQVASQQASLKEQKLEATKAKAKDISSSIKLAVRVLGNEVLFSKLLQQLATVTPPNVRLSALSISQTNGSLNISAVSTTYAAGTQLQVNLADPANNIFDKADIISIGCSDDSKSAYPCSVSIQALFAKNNPFLFINDKGTN
jgi:Tfp pilus assembly protein PilN